MPTYETGDYIKVEFPDEATGIAEWIWVRVHLCDDKTKIVFGILDSKPVNDYDARVELGTHVAIAYTQIRDHKKGSDFRTN
jgi:hypothetical protein